MINVINLSTKNSNQSQFLHSQMAVAESAESVACYGTGSSIQITTMCYAVYGIDKAMQTSKRVAKLNLEVASTGIPK